MSGGDSPARDFSDGQGVISTGSAPRIDPSNTYPKTSSATPHIVNLFRDPTKGIFCLHVTPQPISAARTEQTVNESAENEARASRGEQGIGDS